MEVTYEERGKRYRQVVSGALLLGSAEPPAPSPESDDKPWVKVALAFLVAFGAALTLWRRRVRTA